MAMIWTDAWISKRTGEWVDDCRRELEQVGCVCAASGVLDLAGVRISVHSDFGPIGQDKDFNQDYVLGWRPLPQTPLEVGIHWAVAMADGVSSSYRAEVGAELACWIGMKALVDSGAVAARARTEHAIGCAGDAIGSLADELQREPEAHRPPGEFSSTWNYILSNGLLLQTTLSLAWEHAGRIHLAVVGDGGALAVRRGSAVGHEVQVFGQAPADTCRVHALGPANRQVPGLDCWQQIDTAGVTGFVMFTDGVSRGLAGNLEDIGESMGRMTDDGGNTAEQMIGNWLRSRAEAFDDNLTLAVVKRR